MVEQKSPRKPGRVWRWVFLGSVALNLVFIGLFAGAAFRFAGSEHGPRGDRGGPAMRGYATPYVMALPKENRRALDKEMRSSQKSKWANRAERRAHYQKMVAVIRAEPFDGQAVRQVLDDQGKATFGMLTSAQGSWLAQIDKMTAAERADYADRLEQVLARRGNRGKKGGDKRVSD